MKKKVRFNSLKSGEYFTYYGVLYRKGYSGFAARLAGDGGSCSWFFDDNNVIPITVAIKVKEK